MSFDRSAAAEERAEAEQRDGVGWVRSAWRTCFDQLKNEIYFHFVENF